MGLVKQGSSFCVSIAIAATVASCGGERPGAATRASTSHEALDTTPQISSFVLYAERSIALGTADLVLNGDIGVHRVSGSSSNAQAIIGSATTVDDDNDILAHTVSLGLLAKVGDVETDSLQNNGAIAGTVASFPAAAMPPLPIAEASTPTTTNVTVPAFQIQTLNPGNYGALNVTGTLFLNPGTYSFASVTLANAGHLWAKSGGVHVNARDRLTTGTLATMLPVVGKTASNLRISVSGSDGGAGSWATSIGTGSQVTALLTVPHGTLSLGDNVAAVGAFSGFDITAGHNVTVSFQDGFPPASQQPHGQQQLNGYLTPMMTAAPLVGPVPPSTVLTLAVSLPLPNLQALQDFVRGQSDPTSPSYQQILSVADFTTRFGPSAASYSDLSGWAQSNGLTIASTFPNNMVLGITGTVATIERALFVNLNYYTRPDGTQFYALDREPSLNLTDSVLRVEGLENSRPPVPAIDPTTGGFIGNDFRAAYNTDRRGESGFCTTTSGLDGTGQNIGIFVVPTAHYFSSDISNYVSAAGNTGITPNAVAVSVDGVSTTPTSGEGTTEQSLDIEMANAMAPAATVYSFEGGTQDTTLSAIATNPQKIRQASASWLFCVDSAFENTMWELAAQGTSFFWASGDGGSGLVDPGISGCGFGTPGGQLDVRDVQAITMVGGTQLSLTSGPPVQWRAEGAWPSSGGGPFSTETIPSYQIGFANSSNKGSTTFRNTPDVAMNAVNVEIFANNSPTPIVKGGTSAAAPLWAGYMALVNQAGAKNGVGPIGFANPKLYAIGGSGMYKLMFNDIADNTNSGSFNAVAGYDLVTGLGTPRCALIYGMVGGSSPPTIKGSSAGISVGLQGTTAGPDVCISGTGFPTNSTVKATYFGIPGVRGPVKGASGTTNADGTISLGTDTATQSFVQGCSSTQLAELVTVTVTAFDSNGNQVASANATIPGEFWCGVSVNTFNGGCGCPGGGACGCAAGESACGGTCCAAGHVCAQEVPSALCCASGESSCGGSCCRTGNCRAGNVCCATALCNGQCCNGGSCVNGACCFGPVDASGNCCPLTNQVCSGQCCDGSCTTNDACCATGSQVCGTACCAFNGGEVCLDPSTSTCGAPTQPTIFLKDSLGRVLTILEAFEGSTYTILGKSFPQGNVTVTLTTSAGVTATIATANADSTGTFTTTHVFQPTEGGSDTLTATEGTSQASLVVTVEPLP